MPMPPDSSPPIRMSRSSIRSQMYLKPMPHSCSLRPYFAAIRSSMRVVLKARTTSPGPLFALQKPSQNDRVDLVRVDEAAVFRDRADAVGVAVGRQPAWQLSRDDHLLQQRNVRHDRLRVDSRKERIQLRRESRRD